MSDKLTITYDGSDFLGAEKDGRELRYDYHRGQWQELLWPSLWRDVTQDGMFPGDM